MQKRLLLTWIILGILLTLGMQARQIPERDIALRSGGDITFGHTRAKIIEFGGYSTPECRLAVSRDGRYFYLTKMRSTCWKGTNRKGVKIICNSNKTVCKTRSELSAFARTGKDRYADYSRPSWCRSSHLNATERTICSHPSLGRLDQELARVYGSAKARGDDMGQKQWLRNERNRCGTRVSCLREAYEERIASLKQKASLKTSSRSYRAQNLIGSNRCKGVFPQAILDMQMYGSASKSQISSIKWRGKCDRGWMHGKGKLFFRPKPGSNIDYFYISGKMNHGFFQGNIQVDYIKHSKVFKRNKKQIHLASYEDYRRYETPGGYNENGVNPTYSEAKKAGEAALLGAIGFFANKIGKRIAEANRESSSYGGSGAIRLCHPGIPRPGERSECSNAQAASGKYATVALTRDKGIFSTSGDKCYTLNVYASGGFGNGNTCGGANDYWSVRVDGKSAMVNGLENAIAWLLKHL